ncbi:hypothetical protein K501DRAFT_285506 [Backusella circina FSU 941]|nr:hypothetical protein K501DRAFT_285506 [Backusella circina FSU 941]
MGGQAQQQNQLQYQPQQQPQQQYQQPQQPLSYQQTSSYGNMGNNGGCNMGGMQTTYTSSGALSPAQQQAQWQQQTSAYQFTPSQQQQPDLFSNTPYSPTSGYTQQQQQFTSMPTPYAQQGYGQNQYMQQQDNSNFYIPPNFGMNTTTTTVQQQGPKHPPVDASSLLKGTQVRRVECPICNKMIEGDDMAVNHHVNQHL